MLSIRRCSKCELGSSGDTESLGGGVGYSSKGQHFDLFVGWLIQDCSDDFAKLVVLFSLGKEHAHPIAALELHIRMHPQGPLRAKLFVRRWQRIVPAHLIPRYQNSE